MNRFVRAGLARICLIGLALLGQTAWAQAADANLSAAANQAFLTANAAKPGTVTRPSGLQYRVVHSGVGRHPGAGDWVKVTYSGKLIDGTVFDGTSPGLPATLAVNGIIPGLSEALQLMHEGDRWQIVVPPALGFGPHGSANGAIPPEQALVFDVTLLSAEAANGPQAPGSGLPLIIATEGREQKAVLTIHP
jgi:FKBP-type peptidyl-prolyl cis-trans isomerase FklB